MFITYDLIKRYYEMRFINSISDGGVSIRIDALETYYLNSFYDKFYGLSFGYSQIERYFIQDTSMIFSLILYLGIFSFIFFLIYLISIKFNNLILGIFILIASTKIDVFSFSFWFFISMSHILYFDNMKNKKI
jgi:hypothetical protein